MFQVLRKFWFTIKAKTFSCYFMHSGTVKLTRKKTNFSTWIIYNTHRTLYSIHHWTKSTYSVPNLIRKLICWKKSISIELPAFLIETNKMIINPLGLFQLWPSVNMQSAFQCFQMFPSWVQGKMELFSSKALQRKPSSKISKNKLGIKIKYFSLMSENITV